MPDLKNLGLNLDALRAIQELNVSPRVTEALRELQDFTAAARSSQAWLEGNSATAYTQRLLHERSFGTTIAAMELQRLEEINRLLNPYEGIQKLLRSESDVRAAVESAGQHADLTARVNLDRQTAQAFAKHLEQYRDIAKQHEAVFRLPHTAEAAGLFADMERYGGTVAAYARKHMDDLVSERNLILSMTQPWVHDAEVARSANALIELQGLGSALRSVRGFDEALTVALRADLGDWRDRISIPQIVIDDPDARTALYVERGFNLSLTNFPEGAFQESLVRVGLDPDAQDVIECPESMHAMDAAEEMAFQRTNKCHNYLQRLERRLRQFIDEAMTAQYGADWPKKRLAPQMLESWESKKSRSESCGVILTTFIEVADFTDYEAIICRKDHWREVFQARFKRQESVRESFQRLYPIRLATMHARFVTKEDVIYVLAESRRLLSAIGP